MQIGIVGLGRMGAAMATRLENAGHQVLGYGQADSLRTPDVPSLPDLINRLDAPRAVWCMLPHGHATESTLDQLSRLLAPGDIVVDGSNSKSDLAPQRAAQLGRHGISFLDVGVSGGVWGLARGYALMVGGRSEDVARMQPVFDALKPAGDFGFVHAGPHGAGHHAKMAHNGIEYGMMQAYAEGLEFMQRAGLVTDPAAVLRSWRQGSVVQSWLLELLEAALAEDPGLETLRAVAADSGEARWMIEAAVGLGVPLPVITAALYARFNSQVPESLAMKAIAAMRRQFGGHAVTTVASSAEIGVLM